MRVGSHAIVKEFCSREWEVLYISAPLIPIDVLRLYDPVVRARFKECFFSQFVNVDNLKSCTPFALIAPRNYTFFNHSWTFDNWHKLTMPDMTNKIKKLGFEDVDVLFFDTVFQSVWTTIIKYQKCITRLSDFNSGFDGFSPAARKHQQLIIDKSDLLLSSSHKQNEELSKGIGEKCLHLPNGVNVEMFRRTEKKPKAYRNIEGQIAVFAGVPGHWFDMSLLNNIACRFPDVEFVMIGPFSIGQRLSAPKNVLFTGVLPQSALPGYFQHADVGIIPFSLQNTASFVDYIHPLKLYEYLAAGLPVVSTFWEEINYINSPALLARSENEFAIQLEVALSDNSLRYQIKNFNFTAVDWKARLSPLFGII